MESILGVMTMLLTKQMKQDKKLPPHKTYTEPTEGDKKKYYEFMNYFLIATLHQYKRILL